MSNAELHALFRNMIVGSLAAAAAGALALVVLSLVAPKK